MSDEQEKERTELNDLPIEEELDEQEQKEIKGGVPGANATGIVDKELDKLAGDPTEDPPNPE